MLPTFMSAKHLDGGWDGSTNVWIFILFIYFIVVIIT